MFFCLKNVISIVSWLNWLFFRCTHILTRICSTQAKGFFFFKSCMPNNEVSSSMFSLHFNFFFFLKHYSFVIQSSFCSSLHALSAVSALAILVIDDYLYLLVTDF